MAPNLSLFSVNAILILSPDGTRVLAKYYHPPHTNTSTPSPTTNPYPTVKEQKPFEKGLVEKTAKSNSDIILYDNRIVVFKAESDVMLYVVGGVEENEMLLWHTLLALRDSLNILLKNATDKRTLLENYDIVSLAIDEIVDDGIILETDPATIAGRVSKPPMHEVGGVKGLDLSEQGLLNAWEFGKKQLAERLRQGL
ncbi:snare-like protein [Choiromyces venosus 120613-1]|uniref:Coatomer subunit zeta n=1 Tax=Choiromyces venosus 120613-1 TaxID=1336337 RepID=A0A3N4JNP2_9PEZI|nr:snare-like protein [Choiromyces venosus 120613-1]